MPAKKGHRSTTRKRVTSKRSSTARLRQKPQAKTTERRKVRPARRAAKPSPAPLQPAKSPSPLDFMEITPSLAVRDVSRSRAFYQRLGFHVVTQLPPSGPPEWLRLQRDRVALLVWNQVIAAPEILTAIGQARGAGNAVRITVADVDRLAREFVDNGVHLHHRPETMPGGEREFSVLDPDGFVLEFVAHGRPAPPPGGLP